MSVRMRVHLFTGRSCRVHFPRKSAIVGLSPQSSGGRVMSSVKHPLFALGAVLATAASLLTLPDLPRAAAVESREISDDYSSWQEPNLTYAFRMGSSTPRSLTMDQLLAVYRCQTTGVVDGLNMALPIVPRNPLLPGDGSPLRRAWLRLMQLPEGADVVSDGGSLPSCIDDGPGDGSSEITEASGVYLQTSSQIVPMPADEYYNQLRGFTNNTVGLAHLGYVNGTPPVFPGPGSLTYGDAGDRITYVRRALSGTLTTFTLNQLRAIYRCQTTGAVDGLPMSAPFVPRKPLLPGDGSQLRTAWLEIMGLPLDADVSSDGGTLPECIDDGPGDSSSEYSENTGTVLSLPSQIIPHSVQSYIDQGRSSQGDIRGLSLLGAIGSPDGDLGTPEAASLTCSALPLDEVGLPPHALSTTASSSSSVEPTENGLRLTSPSYEWTTALAFSSGRSALEPSSNSNGPIGVEEDGDLVVDLSNTQPSETAVYLAADESGTIVNRAVSTLSSTPADVGLRWIVDSGFVLLEWPGDSSINQWTVVRDCTELGVVAGGEEPWVAISGADMSKSRTFAVRGVDDTGATVEHIAIVPPRDDSLIGLNLETADAAQAVHNEDLFGTAALSPDRCYFPSPGGATCVYLGSRLPNRWWSDPIGHQYSLYYNTFIPEERVPAPPLRLCGNYAEFGGDNRGFARHAFQRFGSAKTSVWANFNRSAGTTQGLTNLRVSDTLAYRRDGTVEVRDAPSSISVLYQYNAIDPRISILHAASNPFCVVPYIPDINYVAGLYERNGQFTLRISHDRAPSHEVGIVVSTPRGEFAAACLYRFNNQGFAWLTAPPSAGRRVSISWSPHLSDTVAGATGCSSAPSFVTLQ